MTENSLHVERIQSYLRELVRAQCEAVSLPPFTLFFHPSSAFSHFSYAIPDQPVRADDPTIHGTLARLREIFAERGRTPRLEFFEAFAPELPTLLLANGFTEEARQWSMVCTPETYRPAPNIPGLEIVDLTTDSPESDLRGFVIAQHEGFNEGSTSDPTPDDLERLRVLMRDWALTLARVNGEPAAAASFGRIIDGISEVAGIATRPAYRRKGIATLLARRCAKIIFTQGGQIATLTAADASAGRVYEKVGFQPFSTMLAYS